MENKNQNAETTVKGLLCCRDKDCDNCPYAHLGASNCLSTMHKEAIDLLSLLFDENETLSDSCARYDLLVRTASKVTQNLRGEIADEYRNKLHESFAKYEPTDKFNKAFVLNEVDKIAEEFKTSMSHSAGATSNTTVLLWSLRTSKNSCLV